MDYGENSVGVVVIPQGLLVKFGAKHALGVIGRKALEMEKKFEIFFKKVKIKKFLLYEYLPRSCRV
jgi:hypothetical protein